LPFALVKHGVHILENVRTAELAADGVDEFLFVLAAPGFKGAVQSVVHAVAIHRAGAQGNKQALVLNVLRAKSKL
jgi:hypothetical protein